MQISKTLAAALAAAALTTIAGAPALASASQDAFTYRASPPSSNPHDLFRHNIKVPAPEAKTDMAMKECGCPMMKAAATKSGHGG